MKLNMVQALNLAMSQEMERDPDVVLLGEDVAVDGGVVRVTDGLLQKFGPERVIDTPLAESAIVGTAIGMAAYGLMYFLVHDVMVHQRVRHLFVPRSGYLRRIYQAHRLHHAVEERDGAVSFGFLYAPPPEKLAAQIKGRAQA